MNKDNLQRVINAIKFDGRKKFNMNVFLGKLNVQQYEERVFNGTDSASEYGATRVNFVEEGTDIFNCTSMGCIAGFAAAIANDWKAPKWLSVDNHSNQVNNFEFDSNKFLGFTHEEGRNLYFGDSACIWKWLMKHEPERYSQLNLVDYQSMDDAEEEGREWYEEDLEIDFSSIDYLTAVDVLTRILNEEIGLANEDNEPYYVKKEAVVS
ncbi:hypothetical protein UFOVP573_14 [uncultured Caudovirales phage]|uniref:Uncharacterized protein n=1 Tax=uncultured Caudovirales phage TaxID=2100421 RepID=A0A6J5SND7_9CAUD|nr:hypothetical protein UFOVP288_101 [uncultured Caudovirales phage]CAB4146133.1 hypothetical protein UFOVP483_95 [uncultured Caudovirales phage]CAB4150606.1 hypothetical protein UFOVP573_14 [uncultured Caudovirales phage]CAB4161587.1 hypothetical protein UFOVP769_101 [uncultured Caudovirales phage]CAB4174638.1 hypothetical protein UFOVP962_69 [uncultured Caudovirales phage]